MTEAGKKYPSVFTVDGYGTSPPPLPPRPGRSRQIVPTQVLLFLLVSLALCGMVIEAWLIYGLYHPKSSDASMPSALKSIGSAPTPGPTPTKWPRLMEAPSKPLAHLTDGQDVVHGKEIMSWSKIADPLLYRVDYKDGCLIIQKSGFYYVYSKVSFFDENSFHHSIQLKTKYYYGGKSIPLLKSRQYSKKSNSFKQLHSFKQSNSFLAGVFHFYKDDAIFVKVSNTSSIARHEANENVFGAYMI